MSDLQPLPDDVLYNIFFYLTATEVLTMRKVCAKFRRATGRKHVWLMIISRDVYPDLIPTYCKPFDILSARQTEVLAFHLLRVQAAALSGTESSISYPLHQSRSITWIRILLGRWLLVASSDATTSVLSLWSLHTLLASSRDLAAPAVEVYLRGPVSGGEVCISGDEVLVALDLQSFECSVDLLAIRTEAGKPQFVRLANLPGLSRVRCLTGRFVGCAVVNEISIPCLVDWRTAAVLKLCDAHNRQGGCVAMAVKGKFVATVVPRQFEIYVLDDEGSPKPPRRVCKFDLPRPFGFAELMFNHDSHHTSSHAPPFTTLRLLLSGVTELCLYEVTIPRLEDIHFRKVWRHKPRTSGEWSRPSFGAGPASISWLWAQDTYRRPVASMSTFIPVHGLNGLLTSEDPQPTPQTFADPDLPALYAMSVRDHDETRGLLAFGNAFGELTVYDFSGSDPETLAECFVDWTFPALNAADSDRVSTDPIEASVVPPYPYSGPSVPTREMRDALLSRWRPHFPVHPPEGWTTDLLATSLRRPEPSWLRWTSMVGSYSWTLERGLHILGTKIPLMVCADPLMTVFKAGGLLYLEHGLYDTVYVLDEGVTLDNIPPVLDGTMAPLQWQTLFEDPTSAREGHHFTGSWEREWGLKDRNRWQEMKDRGGTVDERWTAERPVWDNPPPELSPQPFNDDAIYWVEFEESFDYGAWINSLMRTPSPPADPSTARPSRVSSPVDAHPAGSVLDEGKAETEEAAEGRSPIDERPDSVAELPHGSPSALLSADEHPSVVPSANEPPSNAARLGDSDTCTDRARHTRRAETALPDDPVERSRSSQKRRSS